LVHTARFQYVILDPDAANPASIFAYSSRLGLGILKLIVYGKHRSTLEHELSRL